MQICSESRPSSTSSLVRHRPDTLEWMMERRSATASNQPQRRLRPGDRAELVADARKMLAVFIEQLGGERPRAHARGVGLHDAEHVVERRADRCPVPVPAKPPVVFDEVTNG